MALCFGQLAYRENLRDIVACLNSRPHLLYHLGFRGNVTRTNLTYANKHRDWRLFQAIAQVLRRRAGALYSRDDSGGDVPGLVFALDSTMISLALNLYPWAFYPRTKQGAVKLHLLLSLKGNLPAWVRLYRIHRANGLFVVRCKGPVSFKTVERRSVKKTHGIQCDQRVRLKSNWSAKSYPECLRRIRSQDPETAKEVVLLTNNFFQSSGSDCAALYEAVASRIVL